MQGSDGVNKREPNTSLGRWFSSIRHLTSSQWLAEVSALVGGGLYLIQSWRYAHSQSSVMDEGLYLVKGYLFNSERYWPFQDFGPLTNHMPLSFLIPGYIQQWFGLGIRTGRYFSLLLGVLMLLALWLTARRLGGKWWAAAAVWAVAMTPAALKVYSIAVTQVLIACMLMWIFVLTLGNGRKPWQLVFGSVLAGLMFLTRLNLAPVLPILLVYVYWEYGRRTGIIASLAGIGVVAIGHAVFWPDILKLWASWIPSTIAPFLESWKVSGGGELYWNPSVPGNMRLLSLTQAVRFHFTSIMSAIGAWLLWPKRKDWKSDNHFRISVFLSALFVTLFLAHTWVSIGKNYCVFCLRRYLAFFSAIGILLLINTFSSRRIKLSRPRQLMVVVTILLLFASLGLNWFWDIGYQWVNIQVPRVRSQQILTGEVELWILIANKFGIEKDAFHDFLTMSVGIGVGIGFLILVAIVKRYFSGNKILGETSIGSLALVVLLFMSWFLPSMDEEIGLGYGAYDCSPDVIASLEEAGQHLADRIPVGSQVYWKGGHSPVPLLYLPEMEIYPAQLNGDYTFRIGGDPAGLEKSGLWNQELAEQWVREADYVLIEEKFYTDWLKDAVNTQDYIELESSPQTVYCRSDSFIRIFRRES